MSKTETVLNIVGSRLDDDPVPILYVGPTRSMVEKIIEPRLMAMARSSPTLWRGFAKGRGSSKTAKYVNGVLCRLAWAGSASELASQEVGTALMDELDRMAFDIKGEGSPIELVQARLATYPNGKLIITSTPTEGNVNAETNPDTGLTHWTVSATEDIRSTIWRLWQEGTRFEWAWPCPHCDDYFVPRFNLLKWPDGATKAQARKMARLVCPHCGAEIEDSSKQQMNERGVYVAPGQSITTTGEVQGEIEPNDHQSFWISGLCSPWESWGQRAADYVEVDRSGDPARVQGVVNTRFGELYRSGGAAPPWQDVKQHGAGYTFGQIPEGPLALTCGVDVQQNRLVYVVRGWAYVLESWLVDYGELFGDTSQDTVWDLLGQFLTRTWGELPIKLMTIDSGYRPGNPKSPGDNFRRPDNMIYRFCRVWAGRAVPTKGHDEQAKPLHAAMIDVKENGQTIKRGLQLWHLDSDYFKSFVHAKLRQPPEHPHGWHLPSDISDNYCQEITAEAKQIQPNSRAKWIRIRKENHVLDCEALNVAAAHILSLQTIQRPIAPPPEPDPDAPKPPPPGGTPRGGRPFATRFSSMPTRNFARGWK